jgi:hypothetical protein
MSDAGRREDRDPAAQVADALRQRLRAMQPQELVELCVQLLTTYVVEGVLPLARAGDDLAADNVGDESFPQLLKRLKATRKDPVLEKFIVDGENVSVRIDGQGVLPITEYRRPTAPPAAAGQPPAPPPRREGAPGAASSIYNRPLYQPDQPAPQRGAPTRPAAPAPAQPAAKPPAAADPKKDDAQKDRFTLIELE